MCKIIYTGKFNVSDMGMRKFANLLLPLLVVILDTICIISAAFFSIYIRFEDTAIAQKYLESLSHNYL